MTLAMSPFSQQFPNIPQFKWAAANNDTHRDAKLVCYSARISMNFLTLNFSWIFSQDACSNCRRTASDCLSPCALLQLDFMWSRRREWKTKKNEEKEKDGDKVNIRDVTGPSLPVCSQWDNYILSGGCVGMYRRYKKNQKLS